MAHFPVLQRFYLSEIRFIILHQKWNRKLGKRVRYKRSCRPVTMHQYKFRIFILVCHCFTYQTASCVRGLETDHVKRQSSLKRPSFLWQWISLPCLSFPLQILTPVICSKKTHLTYNSGNTVLLNTVTISSKDWHQKKDQQKDPFFFFLYLPPPSQSSAVFIFKTQGKRKLGDFHGKQVQLLYLTLQKTEIEPRGSDA